MSSQTRTIEVLLRTNAGNFQADMARAGAATTKLGNDLKSMEQRFDRVGNTLTGAGRTMSAAITLPLAAIGVGSLKAAMDFETSFAGVRKTVDATEAEFAQMSQGFRDMAQEIPVNVNQLNAIGEAAGALGIKKSAILDFTEVVAKMSVTTDLTADTAANAFARISNIMGTSQEDFGRMGSTIVALGNAGASTESEIVEMALRIAGAGKTVGLAETDMLGFASALSSVGIEAEAGGSAISKVMVDIASQVATSGDKLAGFARVAGMSSADFSRAWKDDAAGALVTFIEGLGRMQAEGENVFGTLDELELSEIRVRDALLRAAGAGDLFRDSLKLGSAAWKENTALTDEAAKRFETLESRFELLKNQGRDVAITLGTALMPAAEKVMNFLADTAVPAVETLVEAFEALPEPVQTAIIAGAALLAVVGPIVMGIGMFASGISSILPLLGMLKTAMASANVVMAANPIALVVIALAALTGALIYAYNNSETFRRVVDESFAAIKVTVATVVDFIIGALQEMVGFWFNTADHVLKAAEFMFSWIPGVDGLLAGARASFDQFRGNIEGNLERAKNASEAWKNKTIGDFIAIEGGINRLPAVKSIEITAVDNASRTIQGINNTLNSITSKKVYVDVIRRDSTAGFGRGTSGHTGGQVNPGGIFHAGGAIQRFHTGGAPRFDELDARLQVGEWVIQKNSVAAWERQWGSGIMAAINRGPQATPWANTRPASSGGSMGSAQQIAQLVASMKGGGTTYQINGDIYVKAIPDLRSSDSGVNKFFDGLSTALRKRETAGK